MEDKTPKYAKFNYGYYCPHCKEKIENRKPLNYSKDDEIYPCEFCGGKVIWQPDWYESDLRD